MQRNLRLTLAYDGAGFHGWQRQPGCRTVQEELTLIAQRLLRQPVDVLGASRTDAGVHARGQAASLRAETDIPTERLSRALADRLPEDIALLRLVDAPQAFHATRDAIGKRYRYRVFASATRPASELALGQCWHIWYPLDAGRMQAAAAYWIGRHDFSALATRGVARRTTVRTVQRIEVARRFDEILIDVEGDGFLYNQVRNMVGTLIEIGRGHWPVERAAEVLASRDRSQAGPTAPPHGLCLQWVRYPAAAIRVDEDPAWT
jgi:tRNA pseudouridine38-40 synthase